MLSLVMPHLSASRGIPRRMGRSVRCGLEEKDTTHGHQRTTGADLGIVGFERVVFVYVCMAPAWGGRELRAV